MADEVSNAATAQPATQVMVDRRRVEVSRCMGEEQHHKQDDRCRRKSGTKAIKPNAADAGMFPRECAAADKRRELIA
ncbi:MULTISPECIES: hypothetical protein [unclassified Mesorhizobium]|nr:MULTISPECIES: hypothetical protein [unclassified Mesorhizobium]RUZ87379.1 hypothetical protein EN947_10185 [Mesorhizobium sp. M7A.F.Ca.US.003.02.2.1]RVA14331.1 hypothetical protein EN932_05270 [Mesorhizobium sp. M7A.F.Ca.US.002.01.1.1]RUZ00281.1 hypothetical protein EN974_09665 [Mesorhizobium sp. M7A.F.Ca.CA.001.12.2.1]RUZ27522.1 hypothetical protein EN949_09395 [Mesorhizobium sp. M7A.F.Ca.US.007.01.2.1]RUZ46636.1 hypothetical protein EN948_14980 [Mesorhizobium sp. M7A.F.Ca.US.003.02.1.1]